MRESASEKTKEPYQKKNSREKKKDGGGRGGKPRLV